MKFKEIEFKYNADDVSLSAFKDFCNAQPIKPKEIHASGYDHFFSSKLAKNCFLRHRVGPDMNQLTFKRKLADNNNIIRDEDNLDLLQSVSEAQVKSFAERLGYEFNRTVFKACFIYKYTDHTLVYYILSNTELKEIGRYIEIELSEEYDWGSEDKALNRLRMIEADLRRFGISPQGRMRKSLYEIVCE